MYYDQTVIKRVTKTVVEISVEISGCDITMASTERRPTLDTFGKYERLFIRMEKLLTAWSLAGWKSLHFHQTLGYGPSMLHHSAVHSPCGTYTHNPWFMKPSVKTMEEHANWNGAAQRRTRLTEERLKVEVHVLKAWTCHNFCARSLKVAMRMRMNTLKIRNFIFIFPLTND